MTRDDIIRMARQVGYPLDDAQIDIVLRFQAVLDDFANIARTAGAAAERAACIDDCNAEAKDDGTAQRIVERIRARSQA
jgi:hypothetical protein